MHLRTRLIVTGLSTVTSAFCFAETPLEIFTEMGAKQRASLANISNVAQMKSTMGLCTLEYYEKESTESVDGRGTVEYLRLLSQSEIAERHSADNPVANISPAELDALADELRRQQPQVDAAFRREIQSAELPGHIGQMLLNPPPGKPWLSANPSDMLGMYATMFEGAADGKRQDARGEATAELEAQTDPLVAMAEGTRVVGRERLGNHDTVVLLAEDLNWTQVENGQEFTLNSLRLWIDDSAYVPVKLRMEGEVRDGNNSRELSIEREDTEFQTGSGCGDFKQPLRSVMRIAGVLSPAEQAQMAEAQQKLAEFKLQMDAMPAAQRDMIMRQMGGQMEMFEKMASGGGIEVVSLLTGMRCNADVPAPSVYANTLPGSAVNTCGGF